MIEKFRQFMRLFITMLKFYNIIVARKKEGENRITTIIIKLAFYVHNKPSYYDVHIFFTLGKL